MALIHGTIYKLSDDEGYYYYILVALFKHLGKDLDFINLIQKKQNQNFINNLPMKNFVKTGLRSRLLKRLWLRIKENFKRLKISIFSGVEMI